MKNVIETVKLTKSYGKRTVIKNLNFRIASGEIFGLLGLNGAGKTTTIKMLVGLVNPSVGQVRYMGRNLDTSMEEVLPRIGLVSENPGFYNHLSVFDNLKMTLNIVGSTSTDNVDDVLRIMDIEAYKDTKVKTLSISNRQKLALCRALLNNPDILVLDEPMNGLDPKSVNEIRAVLRRLAKERNVTIIISSHVLSEIELLADRIGFLKEGELVKIVCMKEITTMRMDRLIINCDQIPQALSVLKDHKVKAFVKNKKIVIDNTTCQSKDILKWLVSKDISVKEIYVQPWKLEDMFLEIMGR